MNINYEELQMSYGTNAKNAPIVIMDSGLGGLNILAMLRKEKPSENFVLFMDHGFLPYGNKDVKILSRRVINIVAKLKKIKPKAIIVGCNTIDSVVGDKIQGQVGNIPFFRIIEITAREAVNQSTTKSIALLATPNTVESQKYMIDMLGYSPNTHLYGIECPDMAVAIETGNDMKNVVKEEITPIGTIAVDTIILGCTHYSLVKPIIKKEYPNAQIVDSSEVLVNRFLKKLEKMDYNSANKGTVKVITTLIDEKLEENVEKFLKDFDYEIVLDEMK